MTTSIKVMAMTGNKSVEVEIVAVTANGLTTDRTITLKPGETSEEIHLHDARRVQVREVGEEPKAAPAPVPAPAPVDLKGDKAKVTA